MAVFVECVSVPMCQCTSLMADLNAKTWELRDAFFFIFIQFFGSEYGNYFQISVLEYWNFWGLLPDRWNYCMFNKRALIIKLTCLPICTFFLNFEFWACCIGLRSSYNWVDLAKSVQMADLDNKIKAIVVRVRVATMVQCLGDCKKELTSGPYAENTLNTKWFRV